MDIDNLSSFECMGHFSRGFKRYIKRRKIKLLKKAKAQANKNLCPRRELLSRTCTTRPDYWASEWGRTYRSDRWKAPSQKNGGKQFRRRFRVPYPVFESLLVICRNNQWFIEAPDCTGRCGAPLELKLLGVLRILGRGYCFDGISELSFISEETMRVFFHEFCELFAQEIYPQYVRPPETETEIRDTESVYARLGLPEAIGSTDCVHILWDKCPASETSLHKGKEGFCTLSYEVTVDHTKKILAAT